MSDDMNRQRAVPRREVSSGVCWNKIREREGKL
jgi:hypothetical protein